MLLQEGFQGFCLYIIFGFNLNRICIGPYLYSEVNFNAGILHSVIEKRNAPRNIA